MSVEDDLLALAKRAVADKALEHRIVGIGIAVAYEHGPPGAIVIAPEHLEELLAAAARLEHHIQRALDETAPSPRNEKPE